MSVLLFLGFMIMIIIVILIEHAGFLVLKWGESGCYLLVGGFVVVSFFFFVLLNDGG
jgi:hypothetical protein